MGLDLKSKAALHRFKAGVSGKYGIVDRLIPVKGTTPFHRWRFYRTDHSDGRVLGNPGFKGGNNSGYDITKVALGAFGEAFERYSLGVAASQLSLRKEVTFDDLRGEGA